MAKCENCEYVLSVMTITPIIKLEREKTGAVRIILVIIDVVCVCICRVYLDAFKEYPSHEFIYDRHFSQLENSECCGAIIENKSYAPICVLEEKIEKSNFH